ncbi:ATP-dependent RNA helicase glh-2-like [Asparagus officinalis]|uniref:ATP-dependent RNA helicase glh-2-like n=1 Tax=Asparagus officinalis TaxID=4686 RepID=UPI00098E3C24|nr:ATP-dependent RNA helicase glh-2-like [Asparagus officinalis]
MAKDCRDPIVCFQCQEMGHEARNYRVNDRRNDTSDNRGRGYGGRGASNGGRGFFGGRSAGGFGNLGGRGNKGRSGQNSSRGGRFDHPNPWQWRRERISSAFSSSNKQDFPSGIGQQEKGKRTLDSIDEEKNS